MANEEKRGRGRPKMNPEKRKDKQIIVRADEETFERLEALAKKLNTSKSSAVRTIIFKAENIVNWW